MKLAKILLTSILFVFLISSVVYAQNLTAKINDVEIKVDGDKESVSIGETIDKVKPKSNVKFKVYVENLYTDEIEDIEIEVFVYNIEGEADEDVELEDDISRIRVDDDKATGWMSFDVPLKVDADIYEVEIKGTYDEKDGKDKIELDPYTFELEVEKESHEVIISKAELSENNIECLKRTNLNVQMMNLGENDEDAVLEIISDDLGIDVRDQFELLEDPFDDDNSYSKRVTINTEDLKPGTYPITVNAYRKDGDELEATKNIDLIISECVEEEEEEEPEITVAVCGNNIVETGEECDDGNTLSNDGCSALCKIETTTPTGFVPVGFEEGFWEKYGTTVLIIVGELVFLFIILIIVAVALRKR